MSKDTSYHLLFRKAFKKDLGEIPKLPIDMVDTKQLAIHSAERKKPATIVSRDQSFGLTSFSLYPIVEGKKQGEPNADSLKFIQFTNCSIGIIADGCGWGFRSKKASNNAVSGCWESIRSSIGKCRTTREIATLLVDSMASAHLSILLNSDSSLIETGTTTLLISVTVTLRTQQPYTLVISIGDCQAFLYSHETEHTDSIIGDNRKGTATYDCGGVIGPAEGKNPSLRHVELKGCYVKENDILLMMTDGFHDNFDPDICRVTSDKENYVNSIISPIIKHSVSISDCVQQLSEHIINLTDKLAELHSTLKRRSCAVSPGKLDHSTLLVYNISLHNIDISNEDCYVPNYYFKLYENPSRISISVNKHLLPTTPHLKPKLNESLSQPITPSLTPHFQFSTPVLTLSKPSSPRRLRALSRESLRALSCKSISECNPNGQCFSSSPSYSPNLSPKYTEESKQVTTSSNSPTDQYHSFVQFFMQHQQN
ncbi:hypothetical protein EDI_026630 [Entamoeba dispar SAW760]|uniref:PPM-type phosphatase domain-containing protein n=1 Tax=Entamoeba dispar (strain ATCC PRA-260 / SAW760) TaxID=370354 RepID=B0EPW2_ENTDS|nr:uncharacterized protein EDI_026630 [Entamoeba dispar SAW760]EDR23431.1 hypothetical protein EDI_026630 [Entamoeba dispar SAW760]|eukprot:EDR23431.1 hypothetical protein EDI_026630 [Entamoeba dispar SAW760]